MVCIGKIDTVIVPRYSEQVASTIHPDFKHLYSTINKNLISKYTVYNYNHYSHDDYCSDEDSYYSDDDDYKYKNYQSI